MWKVELTPTNRGVRNITIHTGSLSHTHKSEGSGEKHGGENCENVSQRKSVETHPLGGTQSKKMKINQIEKLSIPNDTHQIYQIEKLSIPNDTHQISI